MAGDRRADRRDPRGHPHPNAAEAEVEVRGEIWYWRGPAPWYFVTVPEERCGEVEDAARVVSYGWGMVPVTATTGRTTWTTSLFPKDGRYVVPLKAAVRRAEGLDVGDVVTIRLRIG